MQSARIRSLRLSSPTTDNQALEILNGVIGALYSGGETAAEAYLASLEPELYAIPIVRWLLNEGIEFMGQFLSIATQKFADQLVIDWQTNREESVLINSATELSLADASGDPDAIKLAIQNTTDAYSRVIHWDGSATPK